MCDPWAALAFKKAIELMPSGQCDECLPDCDATKFGASVTAAPIRKCDVRNLGLSPLCDFAGTVDPPIWGSSVIDEYEILNNGVPSYITPVASSKRKYRNNDVDTYGESLNDDYVFSVQNFVESEYDVYEKDIAVATFYFEESHVFEYVRANKMDAIGYISQIGGLWGLCLGFSFVSALELIYWFTYKFASNM